MSVPIETDEKILTTNDVAELLGVEADTVRKYVQRELLKPFDTIGTAYVFRESEFKRFKKNRRPRGNPTFHRKK